MSWSIGYSNEWQRDIGYGVPAVCDHPDCNKEINRGLSHVCGGEPDGGEHGCGLFFCDEHKEWVWDDEDNTVATDICERCAAAAVDKSLEFEPFKKKPDTKEWMEWKLNDESWDEWREENSEEVERMTLAVKEIK